MNNILERISQISDLENISIGKIEQIIGASKGVLYKAIQKNTDIQSKWVVAIAENFIQYSPEWILTGKGEKLKNPAEKQLEPTNFREQLDDKNRIIQFQEEKIKELQKEIIKLKKEKASSEYNLHVAEPSEKLKQEPKK